MLGMGVGWMVVAVIIVVMVVVMIVIAVAAIVGADAFHMVMMAHLR